MNYSFNAGIWLHSGEAAWHFVSLPEKLSKEIKSEFGDMARGWGSLPVKAKIGKTEWKTSIFPDSKTGTYLLPIKLSIRNNEGLSVGDKIKVRFNAII